LVDSHPPYYSGLAEQPLIVVPLEVNVTVPVGTGEPAGATVAVNVTDWPCVEGFLLDTRVVVDAALLTVMERVPRDAASLAPSPLKHAIAVLVPGPPSWSIGMRKELMFENANVLALLTVKAHSLLRRPETGCSNLMTGVSPIFLACINVESAKFTFVETRRSPGKRISESNPSFGG